MKGSPCVRMISPTSKGGQTISCPSYANGGRFRDWTHSSCPADWQRLAGFAASRKMAFKGVNAPETSVPTLSSDIVPHAGAVRPMSAKPPPVGSERICGLKGFFRWASRRSGLCFPWRASDEGLTFYGMVWVVRRAAFAVDKHRACPLPSWLSPAVIGGRVSSPKASCRYPQSGPEARASIRKAFAAALPSAEVHSQSPPNPS